MPLNKSRNSINASMPQSNKLKNNFGRPKGSTVSRICPNMGGKLSVLHMKKSCIKPWLSQSVIWQTWKARQLLLFCHCETVLKNVTRPKIVPLKINRVWKMKVDPIILVEVEHHFYTYFDNQNRFTHQYHSEVCFLCTKAYCVWFAKSFIQRSSIYWTRKIIAM